MKSYRIVLADDHAMFRQGIKNILAASEQLEVVGEAADGFEVIKLIKQLSPNMVIMDISMPNLRGLEATREIKMISKDMKVLILTMHKDKEYVHSAMAAGAEGYLLKEDADTELFAAIEKIRNNGNYLSPLLSSDMAFELIQASNRGHLSQPVDPLTTREREVLKLVAEGGSNKELADLLCISIRTVESHRANIMRKLDIRDTANLVKYAIRKGYTLSDK